MLNVFDLLILRIYKFAIGGYILLNEVESFIDGAIVIVSFELEIMEPG